MLSWQQLVYHIGVQSWIPNNVKGIKGPLNKDKIYPPSLISARCCVIKDSLIFNTQRPRHNISSNIGFVLIQGLTPSFHDPILSFPLIHNSSFNTNLFHWFNYLLSPVPHSRYFQDVPLSTHVFQWVSYFLTSVPHYISQFIILWASLNPAQIKMWPQFLFRS